jgi:hypothetical protein
MKLRYYLTEATDINYIIRLIDEKCDPYIKELRKHKPINNLLYSGRSDKGDLFIGTVRQDRKPRNTDKERHSIADTLFLKHFGFKARSNAVFVTGSEMEASYYGTSYMVFPMGSYQFVWSPQVRDFTMAIDDFSVWRPVGIKDTMMVTIHGKAYTDSPAYIEKSLDRWISDKYKKDSIINAIKSGNEVMLHCDQYVAVKHGLIFEQEILKWINR